MPTAAAHINRAYELSNLERYELALQEVQRALEADPHSAEAHACGAWVLREQGRLEEAERAARAALAADPQLVQAHNALACTLWSRLRLPEAEAAFQALLACPQDPDRALHLTNYARFLNATRRHTEALAQADRALTLAPTRAGTHEVRGTALYRLGDLAAADAAYREALRLNPRLIAAHQALGELALRRGQSQEAFDSFRAALHHDPTNPACMGCCWSSRYAAPARAGGGSGSRA
jgi:Tfp pilus assembly protein PilF